MEKEEKIFPNWDKMYKTTDVKEMPWYYERLDSDLEAALSERRIEKGKFLDLGTGPGTQAIEMAKRNFYVTGSDLSENAIRKAKEISKGTVNFIVDDILNSKIADSSFNYIFDRGCFHVLPPNKRTFYVKEINRILIRDGILFLKCMGEKERMKEGPYKFSKAQIRDMFEKTFEIQSIKETVYYGRLDPLPKALFIVMKK